MPSDLLTVTDVSWDRTRDNTRNLYTIKGWVNGSLETYKTSSEWRASLCCEAKTHGKAVLHQWHKYDWLTRGFHDEMELCDLPQEQSA